MLSSLSYILHRKTALITTNARTMEFFQRPDAYNVFDYLWPNDLLSLSSTCKALRETVNAYCSRKHQLITSPSSSTNVEEYPATCRYLRWWLSHCLECEDEMEISQCLDIKGRRFIPESLKGYTLIPICSKNCAYNWSYLKKITKTDAKSRYSLNDKELSGIRCIEKMNPVYRNAAPMKLFFESEVELAAMSKFKIGSRHELLVFLDQRREKRATRTEEMRRKKQLTQSERENELRTELEKQGLQLRSDSEIAELYISNSKRGFSLTKSVELIRRAHIVHQHAGEYYHYYVDEAYESLRDDRFYDHETWSDMWKEEKKSVEEKTLRFFAKVKEDQSVKEIRKCECGEPLFDDDELERLREEEWEKFEDERRKKAAQKKAAINSRKKN